MNDRDRLILTEIFNKLHQEISRQDVEPDYLRVIIKELDEASARATLNLNLCKMNKS